MHKNHTIVVFYQKPNVFHYLHQTGYIVGYRELAAEVEALGAQLWFAGGQESYQGNRVFTPGWQLINGTLIQQERVVADVVFDKGRFENDGKVPMFNPPFVSDLCTNKWLMYETFPDLCPNTVLLEDARDMQPALRHIQGTRVVIKPMSGMEGAGVFVGNRTQTDEYDGGYPALMSEFIDSSGGIPGIMSGMHDLRIAILNGQLIYAEYKTPPPNSAIASVTRGGSYAAIPIGALPVRALMVVEQVEKVMKQSENRFYAIDMMFGPHGPRITEMNARPAILPNADGPDFARLKKALAKVLVKF